MSFVPSSRPIKDKYVTIGTTTTSGCKEWSNPDGWQTLIDYLNDKGYKVAVINKEAVPHLKNVLDWTGDKPLEERMNQMHHSEFYVGLGSGLSWLAWSVNKHVVMISNFSLENHEFVTNVTRIVNKSVCNGCWNNPNYKFDRGDWYWCPMFKGTERQFECHKSITAEMVIEQIQPLLK
jgi:autotransporter strand-loop-strand O-heptosyltransferase